MLHGYLDYRDAVYRISSGQAWFILGPKGAGKSAVFEHMRLKWDGYYDRFLTPWDLRGFPVANVTAIMTGQTSGPSRTQSSWEFLLLLRLIESLSRDQGLDAPDAFHSLVRELKRTGLLVDDWKLGVTRWSASKVSFQMNLGPFGVNIDNSQVGPLEIAAVLREALLGVSTSSRHALCLDGLDTFFLETDDEWGSLAGLVHSIESVNRFLMAIKLPVSVVAAVRTEAFEALESTDSNKLKTHSVYLDWSPSGVGRDSSLWGLVDAKVAVSKPEVGCFIDTYLSRDFGFENFRSIPDYFLAQTRLLPRDLMALLSYLQEVHPGSSPVTEGEAVRAVAVYAEQYFVGEIKNNIAGILANSTGRQYKTREFFESLKRVELAEFTLREIEEDLEGVLTSAEIRLLLRQLFEVGAIGLRTRRGSVIERTDFVYRRSTSVAFHHKRSFVLHNALRTAWNKQRY